MVVAVGACTALDSTGNISGGGFDYRACCDIDHKMRFTIPGRLPGLNEIGNANRTHWAVGAKQKKDAQEIVCAAILAAKLRPVTDYPVTLLIVWYERDRRRDKDNVQSAVKVILDALVEMGIIKGDAWKYVGDIHHVVTVSKENPRIEVEILEVDE